MNRQGETVHNLDGDRPDLWTQLTEITSRVRPIDIVFYALILAFGAFHLFSVARASDFLHDDVFFADAGRSIVERGFYGINGYAETNMPPGASLIFALLWLFGFGNHVAFLRVMAVFGALGLLASYELVRRHIPRGVAAAFCLLLISSRTHFELATQAVWPCFPYFFTSISALLIARRFEKATSLSSRLCWGFLLAALIVLSLVFASAGIAFLGAIVASVGMLFFFDRRLALDRAKIYLAVLVCGIAVQGFWMHHREEASAGISAAEWPVPGFPQSYVSQLKVKDGRDPELGMATLRDVPARVLKNAYEHANLLSQMLLQRWIYLAWMSIAAIGIFFLILLGWCYSVWPKGGGLLDWYFAGYEFIYLLWPWELESRFFVPVAPLACLYLWRGGIALATLVKERPRTVGLVWLPMGLFLTVSAWFWMHGIGPASHLHHGGYQDEISFGFWLLSAIVAGWIAWKGDKIPVQVAGLYGRGLSLLHLFRIGSLRIAPLLAIVLVILLVGTGVRTQFQVARTNLDPSSSLNRDAPDAEAAEWIRSNTDKQAVVMARYVPTVFHYSKRRVIWFPPSSDPKLLMEGIVKYKVGYVLVVRRPFDYYLPPDDDCFAPLLKAYPDAFHLAFEAPQFKVFQVTPIKGSPSFNTFEDMSRKVFAKEQAEMSLANIKRGNG